MDGRDADARAGRQVSRSGPRTGLWAGRGVVGSMEKRVRVGSIVVDCKDVPRMMAFWQEALGYVPRRPLSPGDDFMVLRDPTGKGPNVSIDGMEPLRGRIHLDLYTEDPEGEVERLVRLGAAVCRPREPGEDFVVLEDPEGNLFCVVDTRVG